MMLRSRQLLLATAGTLTVAAVAWAQTTPPPTKPLSTSLGMVVFPAKGQAADQQSRDEGECFAWAKGQTGVDPMAPPPAAQPAQQASTSTSSAGGGQRVRGAARGAAAGAIIGEVADNDAGKGAAIGATLGTLKGGSEARKQQEQAKEQAAAQQQQAQQQATAAQQQQLDLFKKGFGACLESKGYTVK